MKISNDYRSMRKAINTACGRKTADAIWQEALSELTELTGQHPEMLKGEKKHVHGYIFPRIALYHAMERHLGSASAIAFLDDAIDKQGMKKGSLLRRMTSMPLMKSLFMKIFASMAKNMFGESGGFRQCFYSASKNEVRFDILDCTYCRWCRKCGCPEIIHTFCKSDEHCFGHLTGIDFVRTQTLEQGTKCDFLLVRKKGEGRG